MLRIRDGQPCGAGWGDLDFACHANAARGDGALALARLTLVRGAAQQARHVDGDDMAGRITGWEEQSIGRNTAKAAYRKNGNG